MKIKSDKETVMIQAIGYIYISVLALLCLIPFLLIISGSFSTEASIYKYGYSFIPKEFSVESYKSVFLNPAAIFRAYGVSIFVTLTGTISGLFLIAMTGYVISRSYFRYRNFFAFFFYFTSIFSGGLIPHYLLIRQVLGWKDNYLALIVPVLMNAFYIILMRNFMKSIPDSIVESAKIDGAGEFRIYVQLMLPLAKPAMATIALFLGLVYWNDWFHAMLYIENYDMRPLQYMLYSLLNSIEFAEIASELAGSSMQEMPTETMKMAMAVIATGPIVLLYPYLQRYFIKGIMIGAVKG